MEEIKKSLEDAGCSEDCIRSFLAYKNNGEDGKAVRLLEKHRNELLRELHESQRKIDCLDYISWQMKKEGYL